MPEEQVPPVVAVVVANDPGRWFEECLEALGAQDYPNLDVLVVDAASHDELTARVAAVLPRAFILRQSEAGGFSAAANEALVRRRGGVSPVGLPRRRGPCARRGPLHGRARPIARMPASSARSSSSGRRRTGCSKSASASTVSAPAVERVEPGELDQAQHDEVREVFAVPGGCTLVRADLFRALGGFDPEIDLFGEDVDLCWRAQVAGARVVVAPAARVRHLELARSGARPVGDVAALRRRHELRAVLKNYDWPRRLLVGIDLAAGSVVEARARARSEATGPGRGGSGTHGGGTGVTARAAGRSQGARAGPSAARPCGRAAVEPWWATAALEAAQGGPVSGVPVGAVGEREPRWRSCSATRTMRAGDAGSVPLRRGRLPRTGWALAALVVVVVFGVRNLLAGHLPLVGQLLPFPAPAVLLREFFGGWQDAGWQATGPAPTAFGLVGRRRSRPARQHRPGGEAAAARARSSSGRSGCTGSLRPLGSEPRPAGGDDRLSRAARSCGTASPPATCRRS